MRCPECESHGLDHALVEHRLRTDLFYFTKMMVSDWVTVGFHKPITEWFQEGLADTESDQFYTIMKPRGGLKTTVFTIAWPLQELTNNPELRFLITMCGADISKQKLSKMQSVVLSPAYKHFFPSLVPTPTKVRWNKSQLELNHKLHYEEPNVTVLGARSANTGPHYDIQILDDLVDGMKVDSELQMKEAMDFIERSEGLWVNVDKAIQLVVGTMWPCPYYRHVSTAPYFKKLILGCYVDDRWRDFLASRGLKTTAEDGESICPERWSDKALERSKRVFKSKFANQMLNIDTPDEARRFRREDIGWFEWGDDSYTSVAIGEAGSDPIYYPIRSMFLQCVIDPGTGMEGGDECGIVVTGWIKGLQIAFVLDVYHGMLGIEDQCRKTLSMARRWGVDVIRYEHAGGFAVFEGYFMNLRRKNGITIPIDKCKPLGRAKSARILDNLEPYVSTRSVYFNKQQPDIVDEMINLVIFDGRIKGSSPNMVDALAYTSEWWKYIPDNFRAGVPFEEDEGVVPDKISKHSQVTARYGLRRAGRSRRNLYA